MAITRISYVLVSRNDSYCGDSVGRLQTVINHTGEILEKHNALEESEIMVVDWASPPENGPLRHVLKPTPAAAKILRIAEVPPEMAARHQKDSPFSEVHAMNVGCRKSSGRYFARIDQDTLIGERFVNWFHDEFEKVDYGFEWPKVAFSGRRNLSVEQSLNYKDYVFNDARSRTVAVCHPDNFYSRLLPPGKNMMLFYGGAVGIMLVERTLYEDLKGFNEEFIYMNNMDTEFLNRLARKTSFYNLGLKVDGDFYHLNHTRAQGAETDDNQPHSDHLGERKTNPNLIRRGEIPNNNPFSWGLNNEEIGVYSFNE